MIVRVLSRLSSSLGEFLGRGRVRPSCLPKAAALCAVLASAMHPTAAQESIPEPVLLWPPEHEANQGPEPASPDQRGWIPGPASRPALIPFLPPPEQANGLAVMICPGGGYAGLAIDKEGYEVARWLKARGAAGFVLRYRCGGGPNGQPIPLGDALRGMQLIRSRASEWGIDKQRVGVLGFSAGGHLASTVATQFSADYWDAGDDLAAESTRPDFAVLIYPVITMDPEVTHGGSRRNLLGVAPSAELSEAWSSELQVSAATPPTFLVHASDDRGVPPQHSLLFYDALQRRGISAELHVFAAGGHGFGMLRGDRPADRWPELWELWLRTQGLLAGEAP